MISSKALGGAVLAGLMAASASYGAGLTITTKFADGTQAKSVAPGTVVPVTVYATVDDGGANDTLQNFFGKMTSSSATGGTFASVGTLASAFDVAVNTEYPKGIAITKKVTSAGTLQSSTLVGGTSLTSAADWIFGRNTASASSGLQANSIPLYTINVTAGASGSTTLGFQLRNATDGGLGSSVFYVNGRSNGALKIVDSTPTSVSYSDAVLTVSGVVNYPGDVNGDKSVTQADLSAIVLNWQKTGMTRIQGDLNGDGNITQADLSEVVLNWQKVYTSDSVVVPEPASLGLLGLAGLTVLRRRRA